MSDGKQTTPPVVAPSFKANFAEAFGKKREPSVTLFPSYILSGSATVATPLDISSTSHNLSPTPENNSVEIKESISVTVPPLSIQSSAVKDAPDERDGLVNDPISMTEIKSQSNINSTDKDTEQFKPLVHAEVSQIHPIAESSVNQDEFIKEPEVETSSPTPSAFEADTRALLQLEGRLICNLPKQHARDTELAQRIRQVVSLAITLRPDINPEISGKLNALIADKKWSELVDICQHRIMDEQIPPVTCFAFYYLRNVALFSAGATTEALAELSSLHLLELLDEIVEGDVISSSIDAVTSRSVHPWFIELCVLFALQSQIKDSEVEEALSILYKLLYVCKAFPYPFQNDTKNHEVGVTGSIPISVSYGIVNCLIAMKDVLNAQRYVEAFINGSGDDKLQNNSIRHHCYTCLGRLQLLVGNVQAASTAFANAQDASENIGNQNKDQLLKESIKNRALLDFYEFDLVESVSKFNAIGNANNIGVLLFYAGDLVNSLERFMNSGTRTASSNSRVLLELGIKLVKP